MIDKAIGLADHFSDAMSPVAYGPHDMMIVLVTAGMSALQNSIPLAFAIVGLPAILTITSIMVILVMAANTSFAIFPRSNAIEAKGGFLAGQFTCRGNRRVYSRGIVAMAVEATFLAIVFCASVPHLILLSTIGVLLSLTLSQAGMAHRWWKSGPLKPGEEKMVRGSILAPDPHRQLKMGQSSVLIYLNGPL